MSTELTTPQPALPTYATVADVLEKKNGSGVALAGWTLARTLMIAPPMMLVGVPAKKAFAGAALSSCLISLFTLIRISHHRNTGLAGVGGEYAARVRADLQRGQYR